MVMVGVAGWGVLCAESQGFLNKGQASPGVKQIALCSFFYLDLMQPPWGKKRLQSGRGASIRLRNGTASLGQRSQSDGKPGTWPGSLPTSSTGTALTGKAGRGPSQLGGGKQPLRQRLLAFWLQLLGMAGGHWFSPATGAGGHLQTELRTLATASTGPKEAGEYKGKGEELESETSLPPHRAWLGGGTVAPLAPDLPTVTALEVEVVWGSR